jgi:hypothetical protein
MAFAGLFKKQDKHNLRIVAFPNSHHAFASAITVGFMEIEQVLSNANIYSYWAVFLYTNCS